MGRAYNLGSGTGSTVLEVLRSCEEIIGQPIAHEIVGRRPGDPGVLIASPDKIVKELGWSTREWQTCYSRVDHPQPLLKTGGEL